ncbi:MAG: DUF4827 domain-containing protein [Paludibacteraceae bacterium]|nr:DUF4827 domain-containing protein [Paludibacteraceae bacterium]
MKYRFPVILIFVVIALSACNRNVTNYANSLKAEKKLIDTYIRINNIRVLPLADEPEYSAWGETDYIEVGDYCYFHLTAMGDTTTEAIQSKDHVNVRYRQYSLTENPDTISYWNTNELPYPIEFQYNVASSNACEAWHLALKHMKYSGAEGRIICPSKKGFNSSDVTPYVYDLKMQIKRY